MPEPTLTAASFRRLAFFLCRIRENRCVNGEVRSVPGILPSWPAGAVILTNMNKQSLVRIVIVALGLPSTASIAWATSEPVSSTVAISHVTVIDATGSPSQPDMTVVIEGDRITALGRSDRVSVPGNARIVDASGKFLIPGLWDMHAHIAIYASMKDTRLPLLIANGVTGIRDLGALQDTVAALRRWREEIQAGTLLGPRIVAAGPILDGPAGGNRAFAMISTEEEARQAVIDLKRQGFDFAKVYSALSRPAYLAIVDEAKRQHFPFAGHVPRILSASEASNLGQRSIEHLTGVLVATSAREEELMKESGAAATMEPTARAKAYRRIEAESAESHSAEKADRLFATFARNGTWQCPTLTVLRSELARHDARFTQDARLKYVAPATRRSWDPASNPAARLDEAELNAEARIYQRQLALVRDMQRAGVGILAGTDMGNPYCFPGSGLHDELELMVEAGLTPMQALQTATLNPARYLGRDDEVGSIGVGKLADLVLLDADPLVDIGNVRQIRAVVVGGRILDRPQLDQLLQSAELAVNRSAR